MKDKLFLSGGILTASLASLCCITPVLAVLGGLGGIAATFSFLHPFRPYFIGLTAIALGFAFHKAYKPQKRDEIDCACENEEGKKPSFINSRRFLWIVTIVSALMITFPYYSRALLPLQKDTNLIISPNNVVQAEMYIKGMTCAGCEASVDHALSSENGVIEASSSYKTGIALIMFDKSVITQEQLKKAVEEKVGYKVTDITGDTK